MINMKKINNLYEDRYRKTLEIIREIHRVIEEEDYKRIIDGEQKKLAPYVIEKKLV